MRKILYLGWIGYHNFGDEWMWHMFQQLSNQYLDKSHYEVIPSSPGVDLNDLSAYDTVVLGGGSLLVPGYVDIMYQAVTQHKKTIIWGSGHDRLHRLIMNDDRTFSPEPANESAQYRNMMKEIIGRSAYCVVRGPWTYDYLSENGVSMDHVSVSGDPAMLAALPTLTEKHNARTDEHWIGINWGTSNNRIYGKNEMDVEDELAYAAQRWIRDGYHIYIYVVWDSDRTSAERLQRKIGFLEHVVFDPQVHTLESYSELMQKFEFTVNLKLHANVLSAASEIPFICLGYRFKSYDFVHSMKLPEIIVPTHAARLETALIDMAVHIQHNKASIINHTRELRQLARKQLETPFVDQLF